MVWPSLASHTLTPREEGLGDESTTFFGVAHVTSRFSIVQSDTSCLMTYDTTGTLSVYIPRKTPAVAAYFTYFAKEKDNLSSQFAGLRSSIDFNKWTQQF